MGFVAAALVSMRVSRGHAVEHPHHTSAATATDETRQEGAPAARGLARGAPLHVGVLEEGPLVLLKLRPSDVALVIVADERPHSAISRSWPLVLRARPPSTLMRLPRRAKA